MNYVFIDTCSWINFASGKSDKSKNDFSDANWKTLDELTELKDRNEIVFLKNEIIDLEFKRAPIEPFVDAYDTGILKKIKSDLEEKVLIHCDDLKTRSTLRDTLNSLDNLLPPFKQKSNELNNRVWSLYNEATQINVSENLKQQALTYAINKKHSLFRNNKNNVNDYLILYSIQEWIQSYTELKHLDETSQTHAIYFISTNSQDFGISKTGLFNEELGISQLIKPLINLNQLIGKVRTKQFHSEDFLPNYAFDELTKHQPETFKELAISKLEQLIRLKKEFFLSYLNRYIQEIETST